MQLRPVLHVVLLIAAMQCVSGFKFRCWLFCTEQTGIQTDYVADRDTCRKYAQLRIDTDTSSPDLIDEKSRKSKLISLFSSCMGDKGWTVPDGKSGQQAAAPIPIPTPGTSNTAAAAPLPAPVAVAPVTAPMPVANSAIMSEAEAKAAQDARREKGYLARASECAFARHGAEFSTVSATRAKACDIECAERLKLEPGGKLPAACPPK